MTDDLVKITPVKTFFAPALFKFVLKCPALDTDKV